MVIRDNLIIVNTYAKNTVRSPDQTHYTVEVIKNMIHGI